MRAFYRFARLLLRHRAALTAAAFFALVSAGGLGAGLVSAAPLLRMILQSGSSLRAEVAALNAGRLGGLVPQWAVDRLPEGRLEGVAWLLGGIVLLTLVGAAANFLHEFLATSVSARTVARVRADAFRTAIHLPLRTVVRRGPAEFVARILRDTVELQRGFVILTSRSIAQVTKGLAALVAAVVIDWRLTLVALVVAPAIAILLRKLGKRIRRGTRGALDAQEDLLRVTQESMSGLRVVKAAGAERVVAGRFRVANRRALASELRVRTARALAGPLVETLAIVVICALVLFAAREIIQGRLAFERFVLALGALGVAGASFKPLTAMVAELQAAEAPAQRLAEILDEAPEDGRRGLPRLPRMRREIRFERVRLRYPGASTDALRGVSLEVPHGEAVAIVGPNGCGKTTLASLVPRLLQPDEGRVVIDGRDIAEVDLHSLRRQVGVVSQETVLFRGTVAENIAFGVAGVSRADVIEAARRAHADEFIRRLPQGYDEVLAEQGASLSGGQRQRLAIARAILRDPAILILDEATSQIDPESERQINEAVAEYRRGRTMLVIAHRISTMRMADRIVVMDEGRIVDEGEFGALVRRCGLFCRLVQGAEGVAAAQTSQTNRTSQTNQAG